MSFGTGKISLRRIFTLGTQFNGESLNSIKEALIHTTIRPLALDEDKEQSSGWSHPFSGEPIDSEFSIYDLVFERYLIIGIRVDTKKIPTTLFRLQMKSALEGLMSHSPNDGDGPKRVPKRLKDACRDRIRCELMRRTLPVVQLYNVAIDLDSGEIFLDSTSKAAFDVLDRLIVETFPSVSLIPATAGTVAVPYGRGAGCLTWKDTVQAGRAELLRHLVPTDIVGYEHTDERPPQDAPPEWRTLAGSVASCEDSFRSDMKLLQTNRQFLGREFLTWLTLLCRYGGNSTLLFPKIPGGRPYHFQVDDLVVVASSSGAVHEARLKGACPTVSGTFKEVLKAGKMVRQAKFIIQQDDSQWKFTMDDNLNVSGLGLPPVQEPDAQAHMSRRMSHLAMVYDVLDALFCDFLAYRLSPAYWDQLRERVAIWLDSAEETAF